MNNRCHAINVAEHYNKNTFIGLNNIAIGKNADIDGNYNNCITIGTDSQSVRDGSVIIASGENKFIDSSSNINFAHILEANSDTKDVIFPGSISSYNGIYYKDMFGICEIDSCDACSKTNKMVGFTWDDGQGAQANLCINCVRQSVMQFQAKERWIQKVGDPISILQNQVVQLQQQLLKLQQQINPK